MPSSRQFNSRTWAAFQGRKQLRVVWDDGPNAAYDSDQFKKDLQRTVRQPGRIMRNEGDVDAEFAKSGNTFEPEYYLPHLAHATMEPPVAVADCRDGKVTVWAPAQNPQGVQDVVAQLVGIPKEDVTCHVTLLGGGFGRKSFCDFAAEAAVLSKKTGEPVKVVWSREDDIKFDYYLPVAAMYLKAALGPRGKPTAWLQRSAFPPINSTFDAGARYGSWELKAPGSKCRLKFRTSASRRVPRGRTFVLAGCGRWPATIIPLPFNRLSVSWRTAPAGIPWSTFWNFSDRLAFSNLTSPIFLLNLGILWMSDV